MPLTADVLTPSHRQCANNPRGIFQHMLKNFNVNLLFPAGTSRKRTLIYLKLPQFGSKRGR